MCGLCHCKATTEIYMYGHTLSLDDALPISVPPEQSKVEADYKRELAAHVGRVFNQLFALANMPIQRFGSTLISKGKFNDYMRLWKENFASANRDSVMRSEERRVGKECVSTCRSRWSPCH